MTLKKPSGRLSKNESLVFDVLKQAKNPLSAYAILDALRPDGLKAPLQVYRALNKLMQSGLAHKIESLNAFVTCRDEQCRQHKIVAFAICDDCDHVSEISDAALAAELSKVGKGADFQVISSTVELHGTCESCRK